MPEHRPTQGNSIGKTMNGGCTSSSKRVGGRSAHRLALLVVGLALLLQNLAPPGYMAGPISSGGWPVVLCPEGLPAGFLPHHHHHGASGAVASAQHDQSLDGHCPLGGVLDTATSLQSAAMAESAAAGSGAGAADYRAPVLRSVYARHRSRAPPHLI